MANWATAVNSEKLSSAPGGVGASAPNGRQQQLEKGGLRVGRLEASEVAPQVGDAGRVRGAAPDQGVAEIRDVLVEAIAELVELGQQVARELGTLCFGGCHGSGSTQPEDAGCWRTGLSGVKDAAVGRAPLQPPHPLQFARLVC